MPPTHAEPGMHALPQPPQLRVSVCVSLHPVMQHVWPKLHVGPPLHPIGWHMPLRHPAPGAHALPQPPQLRGSLVVSLQPVAQHVWPKLHVGPPSQPIGGWQLPPTHAEPGAQALPQPPQLRTSLVVSLHPVMQHVCDPVHVGPPLQPVGWQLPPTHAAPPAH
jgi:hypothetical protein